MSNNNPSLLPGLGAPEPPAIGPAIVGAVEIHMAQITGLAIGDDAGVIGLRGLDATGGTVVFTFPTEIGEICAEQLRRAADGARQIRARTTGEETPVQPMLVVDQPQAFQVAHQDEMVLLAFDPGVAGSRLTGLSAPATMALARELAAHATQVFARQPKRLILPGDLVR